MIDIEIGRTPTGKRSFPLAFRIEFLRRWDACVERGARTRLLREHALAESTVRRWTDARDRGEWTTSMVAAAEKPGRRMDSRDRAELARLRTENEALRRQVEQAEAAQEILGKAFELLEQVTKSSTPPSPIPPALMSADEYAQWLTRHKLS
ncbi:hypothetical protein [Rhodococcus rhodochrous]|uniref:Transposase n=1 Tax=Rhodococcus rhodochrous KG-21 TaxID=1441923 RepID=A0A0M9WL65_RHORH|nr:hypothetical protein [Rhodococcus rhodochrous]KOS53050.1 hypothetical protein Z051_27710 [Rhodococcus rhodochrous KG-21]